MSINANIDLNTVILRLLESPVGLVFLCLIMLGILLVFAIYFIAKSGFISGLREHSEHRNKKINDQITEQEKLLNDTFLTDFKDQLTYHIKVSKLENYLNIRNRDMDLLKYILSCCNKEKAVKLYKIGKDYLNKDPESNTYKLKPKYTKKRIKLYGILGTTLYFIINFIGAGPYIAINLLKFFYRDETFTVSDNLNYLMLFFFIIFFVISFLVLWHFLRPEAAKNFLELEKINNNQTKTLEFEIGSS